MIYSEEVTDKYRTSTGQFRTEQINTGKEPYSFVRGYPFQVLCMFKTLYRICRTLADMERI